jgi:hypothetical protein
MRNVQYYMVAQLWPVVIPMPLRNTEDLPVIVVRDLVLIAPSRTPVAYSS